jgi:hypothetical protein
MFVGCGRAGFVIDNAWAQRRFAGVAKAVRLLGRSGTDSTGGVDSGQVLWMAEA